MKAQYVKELAIGARVDSPFVLAAKEMRASRAGDAFLALELSDRSGRIPAVWFRPTTLGAAVPVGSVIRISGRVTSYRGVKRVSLDSCVPAQGWEAEDMLASARTDRSETVAAFRALAGTVRDSGMRRVLKAVFGDLGFFERFTACPGSQSHHHAYLGGLIEHSLSVARICDVVASTYPQANRDVLLTAALLHDIGKVDELSWNASIEYTDEGRLLGHVVLGERRLVSALTALRVPLSDANSARLSHALLSHHGELEWGSPKRPSTIEALLLHHADNMDAKASGFAELVNGPVSVNERWTDSQNLFRRPLYAPAAAEDERPMPRSEDGEFLRVIA